MKILIATKNAGKFGEIMEVLSELPHEFVSLADLGITADCSENGESFEENALEKARFYAQLSGLPTIADDSGIFVEALSGELGVKTRRWGAGEAASDEEWLAHFLERMQNEKNRDAHFVCVSAFVNGNTEQIFLGETRGTLSEKLEAPIKHGIPLSSMFIPLGHTQVYSTLSVAEKNMLSHRGKAFRQLLHFLRDLRDDQK